MIRLLLSLVVAALITSPLGAQEGLSFESFKASRTDPIEVNSDKLELVQSEQKAIFRGQVVATQGELTMRARALALIYNPKPDKARGEGPISRVEANGRVTLTSKTEKAEADTMIYLVDRGLIKLNGNVQLVYSGNTLEGESLIIDLVSGLSRIEGGPRNQGRVRAVFNPQTIDQGEAQ